MLRVTLLHESLPWIMPHAKMYQCIPQMLACLLVGGTIITGFSENHGAMGWGTISSAGLLDCTWLVKGFNLFCNVIILSTLCYSCTLLKFLLAVCSQTSVQYYCCYRVTCITITFMYLYTGMLLNTAYLFFSCCSGLYGCKAELWWQCRVPSEASVSAAGLVTRRPKRCGGCQCWH